MPQKEPTAFSPSLVVALRRLLPLFRLFSFYFLVPTSFSAYRRVGTYRQLRQREGVIAFASNIATVKLVVTLFNTREEQHMVATDQHKVSSRFVSAFKGTKYSTGKSLRELQQLKKLHSLILLHVIRWCHDMLFAVHLFSVSCRSKVARW